MARRLLRRGLGSALADLEVALCMHRVSDTPPAPGRARYTVTPRTMDALIELLRSSRPRARQPWLTVTFDDGYRDAAAYVADRAPAYPDVRFLFFVCAEKTEAGGAFRWDAPAQSALVASPAQLATVAEVNALQQFPNVTVGDHTNTHVAVTALSPAAAAEEFARSQACFERLFGPRTHFAFPFGTPMASFDHTHVALLRAQGPAVLWSTEPRPFQPGELGPGAVLPRLTIDGRWSLARQATWLIERALMFRARGPRFHWPVAPEAPSDEAVQLEAG